MVKAEDNELLVEIAKDIRVRIARSVISEVLGKPEPAAATGAAKGEAGRAGDAKTGLMGQLFGKNLMSQLFGKK